MAAKFMGEPSKVVTGSHDRTLKVWDLRNKACKCLVIVSPLRFISYFMVVIHDEFKI